MEYPPMFSNQWDMKHILIVDDEQDMREILKFNFKMSGYTADTASSAEEALEILSREHDLIMLDIMMQGMSGIEMAKKVRGELNMSIPIIFLTARDSDADLLKGFSAGGDDYVTKPFSFPEILARVNALLWRMEVNAAEEANTTHNGITIDELRKQLILSDGSELQLPPKEFGIISVLLSHPDKVFTRAELMDKVWGDHVCVSDRTVDVHITRLRKKLEGEINIINRQGFGYCIEDIKKS